jgi:hypothetical protein
LVQEETTFERDIDGESGVLESVKVLEVYFEEVSPFGQSFGSVLSPIVRHLVGKIVLEIEPKLLHNLRRGFVVSILENDLIIRRKAFDSK